MKKRFLLIVTFFLTVVPVVAQDVSNTNWLRLESDSKDFTIAVPPGYQVIADKDGYQTNRMISRNPFKSRNVEYEDIKRVTAFIDGASFLIESYRVNKVDDALEELYTKQRPEGLKAPQPEYV